MHPWIRFSGARRNISSLVAATAESRVSSDGHSQLLYIYAFSCALHTRTPVCVYIYSYIHRHARAHTYGEKRANRESTAFVRVPLRCPIVPDLFLPLTLSRISRLLCFYPLLDFIVLLWLFMPRASNRTECPGNNGFSRIKHEKPRIVRKKNRPLPVYIYTHEGGIHVYSRVSGLQLGEWMKWNSGMMPVFGMRRVERKF